MGFGRGITAGRILPRRLAPEDVRRSIGHRSIDLTRRLGSRSALRIPAIAGMRLDNPRCRARQAETITSPYNATAH
jgi:hypothetical protein